MEEEKGRNNKGIFPVAILFTAEISHVIPAYVFFLEYRVHRYPRTYRGSFPEV